MEAFERRLQKHKEGKDKEKESPPVLSLALRAFGDSFVIEADPNPDSATTMANEL